MARQSVDSLGCEAPWGEQDHQPPWVRTQGRSPWAQAEENKKKNSGKRTWWSKFKEMNSCKLQLTQRNELSVGYNHSTIEDQAYSTQNVCIMCQGQLKATYIPFRGDSHQDLPWQNESCPVGRPRPLCDFGCTCIFLWHVYRKLP